MLIHNINLLLVISEEVSIPGTATEALFWGIVAYCTQPIAAIVGAKFKISNKFISISLAFTSGVLIALLSYDLLDAAFQLGGLLPSLIGLSIGIFIYNGLNKLVSRLPEGIDTFVGDRGTRLSGGQIQRIGIARAIFNNSKILIFDEATSALDIETEKNFVSDIYKLKAEKTLIIISHRLSILDHCDRIYRIKDKKIFLEKENK